MNLKKRVMRLQITVFKNCNKGTPVYKNTENEKFMFWINTHTPIEKQSNQDWNSSIYLKNIGPHVKVASIFSFSYHDFLLMFLSPIVG